MTEGTLKASRRLRGDPADKAASDLLNTALDGALMVATIGGLHPSTKAQSP